MTITCAGGRGLSNDPQKSMIHSKSPEKNTNNSKVDWKKSYENLVPLPTCTSLLMPTKKKKKQNRQKKSERKELEEKKGKVKFEAVTLTVKPKIKTILIF